MLNASVCTQPVYSFRRYLFVKQHNPYPNILAQIDFHLHNSVFLKGGCFGAIQMGMRIHRLFVQRG